jgi:hypothetical protein
MSESGTRQAPAASWLFREGVQYWLDHQRDFWLWAGPCALLLGLADLLRSGRHDNGVTVLFVYAGVFNWWLTLVLYPDAKLRREAGQRDKKRRTMGYFFAFFGFCSAFGALASLIALLLGMQFHTLFQQVGPLLATTILGPPVLFLCAALFACFLLYLPALVAFHPLGLADAFALSHGVRGRLIGFALLCTAVSLIATVCVIAAATLRLPNSPWSVAAIRAAVAVIDLTALYILAFGLVRLFEALTGWRPEPVAPAN